MFPTHSYVLQAVADSRRQEMIDAARDSRLADEGRRRRRTERTVHGGRLWTVWYRGRYHNVHNPEAIAAYDA